MRRLARRALTRAGQFLLNPLERKHDALRQQLVKRLDRLDERVERALVEARQNAALLAGSRADRTARPTTRGGSLPREAGDLIDPIQATNGHGLSHETVTLTACPCCACGEFTLVSEFNR